MRVTNCDKNGYKNELREFNQRIKLPITNVIPSIHINIDRSINHQFLSVVDIGGGGNGGSLPPWDIC